MKSSLKILFALLLGTFLFSSCSKDDDPANNDFFVGTYDGSVSYNTNGTSISDDNSSVVVTKVASGTTYNFHFSKDGIPDINGVQFEKRGDNVYYNIGGEDGVNYIRIDANSLKLLYSKDGATWTADCTR